MLAEPCKPGRLTGYAPLALAILTAALLQAIHIARAPTISADGITFIAIARELPEGLGETFRRHDQHPGYPALLLTATRVVQGLGYHADPQSWTVGGIVVSYLCGLATVAVVWLLTRQLFDTRLANIAAFVFAVLPIPCWSAGDAHSDTPHLLAYLTAALLASSGVVSGRLLPLAGAGAASAIAYWIRPEGLEVFLVAMVCLVWQAVRMHWTWRRMGLACATLAGATVVIAAPYPILAGKVTSKQLPFAKSQPTNTFLDLEAAQSAAAVVKEAKPQAAAPTDAAPTAAAAAVSDAVAPETAPATANEPPAAKPRYTAKLVLRLLGKAFEAFIVSICQGFKFVFIPLYLIGQVVWCRRTSQGMQLALLALLAATHFVVLIAVFMLSGYIAHRHVLPVIGLAMPATALGVMWVGEFAARRIKAPPVYVVPILLAICCVSVLPYTVRAVNREFLPVLAATQWVQSRAEPGSGIVCNSPYVEFYGTLPVAYLSPESPTFAEALAKANAEAQYDYVVLHVNAHDYRPEWLTQLEPRYRQVRMFPDPYSIERPKKVLVFEAKEGHVRRPAREKRS
jgi:hypothetical protein